MFCNQCGHRNPPESMFCSSCGGVLDRNDDHTITIAKIDPLQEAPGAAEDITVTIGDLNADGALGSHTAALRAPRC